MVLPEFVMFLGNCTQEAGAVAKPHTAKLAAKSGKNEARDFWKHNDIPVVACLKNWYL